MVDCSSCVHVECLCWDCVGRFGQCANICSECGLEVPRVVDDCDDYHVLDVDDEDFK